LDEDCFRVVSAVAPRCEHRRRAGHSRG
jgi:hypothetical protein